MIEFYLIIVIFSGIILGPVIMYVLQLAGVKWTYKIGFKIGEFNSLIDNTTLNRPTYWVKVKERNGTLLVSEQLWMTNPKERWLTSGWPDKLIGVIERHGSETRLTLRTDIMTTFLWVSFVIFALMGLGALVAGMPGVQGIDGLFFALGFSGFSIAGLVSFVRRTKRRAMEMAEHLGFPVPQGDVYLPTVSPRGTESGLVEDRSDYLGSTLRSVAEIEAAITKLSPSDVEKLAVWLADYRNRGWDEQIGRDLDAGRLDAFLDAADREYERRHG